MCKLLELTAVSFKRTCLQPFRKQEEEDDAGSEIFWNWKGVFKMKSCKAVDTSTSARLELSVHFGKLN